MPKRIIAKIQTLIDKILIKPLSLSIMVGTFLCILVFIVDHSSVQIKSVAKLKPSKIFTPKPNSEDNRYIAISVADEGVGISPDTINKLFKFEEKNSTKGTNNEGGTGLGLILCKEFMDKHNCQLGVESTLGDGTIFNFTLPKC